MAIDTAQKRRAVAGILTGVLPVAVTPNVAPDAAWRQEAGWGYSGIPADEDSDAVVIPNITFLRRRS